MSSARRDFLRTLGFAVAAGMAPKPGLAITLPAAGTTEPVRSGQSATIHLNNNENAYGPSESVLAAIRSGMTTANRYPEAGSDELIERIAQFHHVKAEQVIVGCGSTEVLQAAALTFLGPGKKLVQALPTYEAMEYYARSSGAEVVSLPLTRRFAHDLDAMLARVDGSTGLVYICNPNNPTASVTPRAKLEEFIAHLPPSCCVLIDEAYHHFARQSPDDWSFVDHFLPDGRIIVTRSFSHAYGLAGLRIGYGVAPAEMVRRMRAHMPEDNINAVAARAAIAALADTDGLERAVKRNANDRQEFFNQAMARAMKPIDSHANFAMMNTYYPATMISGHFRENNILIGPVFPALNTHIRVSFGMPEEMEAFWRVWDTLPVDKASMHH